MENWEKEDNMEEKKQQENKKTAHQTNISQSRVLARNLLPNGA